MHAAHEMLVGMGYKHTHHEAQWEDVGGPESGPDIQGHNEYDEYESAEDYVYVTDGVAYFEKRDLEQERYVAEMFG